MSFSSETKQEITHIELDKKCCQLAEIAGFVRMCGSITLIGGKMGVRLTTDSPATARLFAKLLKSYFDTKADLNVEDTTPLKKGHAYQLIITPDMNADLILRETGILGVKEGSNYITDGIPADLIRKKCCKKAYLRGIFLGAGTISAPQKGYHLEFVCNSEYLAGDVKKLINSFGLNAKVTQRKEQFIVYLKDSEQIIDLLNILGAHGQLLTFENVKIMKEMKNKTNRIMNCESANLDKTVNTAGRQIAAIEKIKNSRGLASLPPKLFEAANLRLEHPEATLAELAELADPPLAKSGLNHRLKKIEEIASKIEA